MSLTDEQILTDHELRKYYIMRSRCEVCRTKTWHYYFFESYDFQPIGELKPVTHITETSRCIEHSFIDDYERLRMFKDGRLKAFSLDINIDPKSNMISWEFEYADQVSQE